MSFFAIKILSVFIAMIEYPAKYEALKYASIDINTRHKDECLFALLMGFGFSASPWKV